MYGMSGTISTEMGPDKTVRQEQCLPLSRGVLPEQPHCNFARQQPLPRTNQNLSPVNHSTDHPTGQNSSTAQHRASKMMTHHNAFRKSNLRSEWFSKAGTSRETSSAPLTIRKGNSPLVLQSDSPGVDGWVVKERGDHSSMSPQVPGSSVTLDCDCHVPCLNSPSILQAL